MSEIIFWAVAVLQTPDGKSVRAVITIHVGIGTVEVQVPGIGAIDYRRPVVAVRTNIVERPIRAIPVAACFSNGCLILPLPAVAFLSAVALAEVEAKAGRFPKIGKRKAENFRIFLARTFARKPLD